MMPGAGREERRKKQAPVVTFIVIGTLVVSELFQPGWQWVPFAVGMSVAVGVSIGLPGGRLRDGHRRGSALIERGRDDVDGAGGAAAHQWHMLVMVSRLMPGPAGRRWLAEAESVLPEIAPVRRGAAVRSYILSAPGLAVTMWAREVQRRARPGPRRPG
jgi:hypothetical protein